MRKILALLALIVSIFTLAACATTHGSSYSKHPASMIGQWSQINAHSDGWMTASISHGSIQVHLESRDSSSIFWQGTFETSRLSHPSGKFKVVSIGDQDAMRWDITASTEPQKTFTYDHGILSFQFSAMGSSTTVRMSKNKPVRTIVRQTPSRTVTQTPTYNRPSTLKTPSRTTSKPAVTKTTSTKK